MEIKVLESKDNKLKFLFKDTDAVTVNTIRRIILSEIPVLAIKSVSFIKNSSALFDEIIAHRLGLIPLKANLSSFNLPEKCTCKGKGCGKCQITLSLNSEGPITVYADDLKFKGGGVEVVYPKMPLIKLLKGQELEFEATATLGKGKDHAKYSPGLFYYQGYPKIKVDKCNGCGDCVKVCPINILEVKGRDLKVNDPEKCTLCLACVESCPKKAINIEASEKDFIVTIESWGQLTPKEMLLSALDELENKLEDFSKSFKKA